MKSKQPTKKTHAKKNNKDTVEPKKNVPSRGSERPPLPTQPLSNSAGLEESLEQLMPPGKAGSVQPSYLYMTVSQVKGISIDQVVKNMIDVFDKARKYMESYYVCEQQHEDLGIHFHFLIKFRPRLDLRTPKAHKMLDEICGKHGNYQVPNNWKRVLYYISNPEKNLNVRTIGFDVDSIRQAIEKQNVKKKDSKWETTAKNILEENKKVKDLVIDQPGFVAQNFRKLQEFISWHEGQQKPIYLNWHGCAAGDENPINITIAEWLNENLFKVRKPRQKQLWIFGPTACGKSRLLRKLKKFTHQYVIPIDDKWYCGFENNKFDLAVLDEFSFKGKLLTWLNQWLEGGSNLALPQKNKTALVKTHNIPTIICSNHHPENVYKRIAREYPHVFQALMDRLVVVQAKEVHEINIKFFKEHSGSQVINIVPTQDPSPLEEQQPLIFENEGCDPTLTQLYSPVPLNLREQLVCDEVVDLEKAYQFTLRSEPEDLWDSQLSETENYERLKEQNELLMNNSQDLACTLLPSPPHESLQIKECESNDKLIDEYRKRNGRNISSEDIPQMFQKRISRTLGQPKPNLRRQNATVGEVFKHRLFQDAELDELHGLEFFGPTQVLNMCDMTTEQRREIDQGKEDAEDMDDSEDTLKPSPVDQDKLIFERELVNGGISLEKQKSLPPRKRVVVKTKRGSKPKRRKHFLPDDDELNN